MRDNLLLAPSGAHPELLLDGLDIGKRWQAGLVAERPEGRNVFYRANPGGLAPLADWMNHYSIFWRDSFDRLRDLLAEIDPAAAPVKPALSASAGSKTRHASARKKTRDIQND